MLDGGKAISRKKNLTMSQWVEQVIQQALQMGGILERKDLLQLLKNNIGIHDYEFKTVNIETCL